MWHSFDPFRTLCSQAGELPAVQVATGKRKHTLMGSSRQYFTAGRKKKKTHTNTQAEGKKASLPENVFCLLFLVYLFWEGRLQYVWGKWYSYLLVAHGNGCLLTSSLKTTWLECIIYGNEPSHKTAWIRKQITAIKTSTPQKDGKQNDEGQ